MRSASSSRWRSRTCIDAVDLTLIGWILAGCGALVLVLAAMQNNRTRGTAAVATTTHSDGTQTTTEKRSETDPPAPTA